MQKYYITRCIKMGIEVYTVMNGNTVMGQFMSLNGAKSCVMHLERKYGKAHVQYDNMGRPS
jgi:hypothetical protein